MLKKIIMYSYLIAKMLQIKLVNSNAASVQGRQQKNFQRGQWKKQDRKIAPLSLYLLYQYHV